MTHGYIFFLLLSEIMNTYAFKFFFNDFQIFFSINFINSHSLYTYLLYWRKKNIIGAHAKIYLLKIDLPNQNDIICT